MFVVDIPESSFPQNSRNIGNLKEHECFEPRADRSANHVEELTRRCDVFENMPAHDKVWLVIGILLGIEVRNESNLDRFDTLQPIRSKTGINANPLITAQLAKTFQEATLTATDF